MLHKYGKILRTSLGQCQVRQFQSGSQFKEAKLRILDADINYIETVGSSPNASPIFYLPGAFGSIEMDFKPIMHQFNKEKYKWISWDPPGYGKSRPPNRQFLSDKYESVNVLDVEYATELMNKLGHQRYTLLAWSGAALTAILMASEQPQKISGLITWGAFGYVAKEMIPGVKLMKKLGLNAIPDSRRAPLLEMYGEKLLIEMWNGWVDEAIRMTDSKVYKKDGTFRQVIQSVQCPTLVIHGMKDALIDFAQAEYLANNFKHARLHVMPNGTHNLHLRETQEFVTLIQDFVDNIELKPKKYC